MAANSFSEAKLAVLLKLYFTALKNINDGRLTSRQILSLDFDGTPRTLIEKTFTGLEKDGLILQHQDFSTGDFDFAYEISAEGLGYVEAELEKYEGYLAENFDREREWANSFSLPEWSPTTPPSQSDGLPLNADASFEKFTGVIGGAPQGTLPHAALEFPPSTAPNGASTTSTSQTLGFASDSAPFGSGVFEDRQSTPASNRYVSVRDNQASFDELLEQLNRIKTEYERDHNRLANAPQIGEILAETEAAIAQIKHGFVRLEQIARGLIPTYEQGCLALAAYPGMSQLMSDAISIAQHILRFFGFL